MANMLQALFSGKLPQRSGVEAPIGTGMARMGVDTVNARRQYNAYVEAIQTEGGTPMSFEEWRKASGL